MLKSFVVFTRFVLFWLIYFLLDRAIFLAYFYDKITELSGSEIAKTFLYGLRLDLSTIGYISAFPLIFYIICWFFPGLKFSGRLLKIYVIFLIILFSLFTIINFNVYREWGSKVNYKILELFFGNTSEAIASSASSPVTFSFVVFGIFAVFSIWLSYKLIRYHHPNLKAPVWIKTTGSFLALGICFLAIRGGWQLAPVNESMSYFSTNTLLNHAAVNTEWNLLHDIINSRYTKKNPFNYMTKKEADELVKQTLKKPVLSQSPAYFSVKHPNVMLIIMESFTADVVASLGGEKGVSPNYDLLAEEGIAFSHIYAAGDRTDKGLIATISGFPAQGGRSIVKQNDKQEKLPALSDVFNKKGYSTYFYYGGESEFFNQKSYIISHNYKNLVDEKNFSQSDMNSKWGAYDGTVYTKMLQDLETVKQPFFTTFLTLTNHEPFELPVKAKFKGDDLPSKFKSTSFYADSCLGAFIKKARRTEWFKNTLFVVVADHGHRLPADKYENYDPHRYRIPLLFFGDVIKPKYRGKQIDKIGSQTDIPTTILNQLGYQTKAFDWGKDLLNPYATDFAFYNWDGGFGVVSKDQAIAFDAVGGNILYRENNAVNSNENNILLKTGKAFMQSVYQQYIDY